MSPRVSGPLRQRALYWVTRIPSFSDAARLITEFAGDRLFSEDTLWRLVQGEADDLDTQQFDEIVQTQSLPEPAFVAVENVYDPQTEEFVVMTDAIGVKAQKPTREPHGEAKKPKEVKRHDTDVMILPRPDGTEQFVCEGISGRWTLAEAVRAFLRRAWTGKKLQVVALTDGAKTIRADLAAIFGVCVFVILDWYHLQKKVYQLLSMAAHKAAEREEWEQKVLGFLWRGRVPDAKAFLATVKPRNDKARQELIGYIDKHASEIIDYERRKQAGKVIGSGRMEKGVDQVVGHRQKGKGMSWTLAGTRALALLKVAELNGSMV
jgi:hypothetical protein